MKREYSNIRIFVDIPNILLTIFVQNIDEAVLRSTHNLFLGKNKKNVNPCKPHFHSIVGYKGVFIIRTCLHDGGMHNSIILF